MAARDLWPYTKMRDDLVKLFSTTDFARTLVVLEAAAASTVEEVPLWRQRRSTANSRASRSSRASAAASAAVADAKQLVSRVSQTVGAIGRHFSVQQRSSKVHL